MQAIDIAALVWSGIGLLLLPIQLLVTAPYGRHAGDASGPKVPNQLGWFAMEVVSLLVFAGLFLAGPQEKTTPMWVFFALWSVHYINRSLIYPWRTHTAGKTMPLLIVVSAAGFNLVNGGLNGLYLGWLGPVYPASWLADPRYLFGIALFVIGAAINIWSDNHLIALRTDKEDYAIPHGGPFELVSCPNHLGEIIQWCGFALLCWNLPALSFAIWTTANLVPRAISHHRWYREKFPNYPRHRRAVLPGLL